MRKIEKYLSDVINALYVYTGGIDLCWRFALKGRFERAPYVDHVHYISCTSK